MGAITVYLIKTMNKDYMKKYKLDILGIRETHLTGTGILEIKTSDNTETFELYYTGPKRISYHGFGIVVRNDLLADYLQEDISERICKATFRLEGNR